MKPTWVFLAFAISLISASIWHHREAAERPPSGWVDLCERGDDLSDYFCIAERNIEPFPDYLNVHEQMRLTTRLFNRLVRPLSDEAQYGVSERWTVPRGGFGDCEDYVLIKMMRLHNLGFPESAVRILHGTRKSDGEGHAVLTVNYQGTLWVLDNLTDDVVPLKDASLAPVAMQSARSAMIWERL